MQEDTVFPRSSPGFQLLGQGPEKSSRQPLWSLKAQRKWKETWHTVGTNSSFLPGLLRAHRVQALCFQASKPPLVGSLNLSSLFYRCRKRKMNCLKQEQGQDPFSLTLETVFLLWRWSSAGGDLVPDNGDTVGFHSVKGPLLAPPGRKPEILSIIRDACRRPQQKNHRIQNVNSVEVEKRGEGLLVPGRMGVAALVRGSGKMGGKEGVNFHCLFSSCPENPATGNSAITV